jgi:hemoglobin
MAFLLHCLRERSGDAATAARHKNERKADMDAPTESLYDRLGGLYSIATVVDDFIDRIMVDERLNSNPRVDEAHHRVLPPGFKYLATEMLAEAAGGPQHYTGRSMVESHRELHITPGEWRAFMDDLNHTLDKFEVPQQERSEVVAIVESTRGDIVVE